MSQSLALNKKEKKRKLRFNQRNTFKKAQQQEERIQDRQLRKMTGTTNTELLFFLILLLL